MTTLDPRTEADAESGAGIAGSVAPVPTDEVFDVLGNARRRAVVRYLLEHGEVEMGTLAERVAAEETGTTPEEVGREERRRIYISLYQSHLPKLADVGVASYDRDRGVVEPTAAIEDLAPYLDVDTTPDGLPTTRIAVAGGTAVVVAASVADLGPFSAVSDAVAAGLAAAVLVLVVLYRASERR
jgi:DNA-binding transcriptional ArsR family regulator